MKQSTGKPSSEAAIHCRATLSSESKHFDSRSQLITKSSVRFPPLPAALTQLLSERREGTFCVRLVSVHVRLLVTYTTWFKITVTVIFTDSLKVENSMCVSSYRERFLEFSRILSRSLFCDVNWKLNPILHLPKIFSLAPVRRLSWVSLL